MNRQTNLARTLLLQTLSDGQFHSGELLGEQLGLSRAAVSKHMKALGELGLDIFSVTGKGYKLAKPLSLLDHTTIAAQLSEDVQPLLNVLNVIDSTNQYVKDRMAHLQNGFVCIAEAQTQGRGRHGRTWISPYGASLYLSMYWSFAGGYQSISGLSLVMGIAIAKALTQYQVTDVKLKWPNDVYIDHKKIAGVLIEVEGQLGTSCDCVIGIGLNVDLPKSKMDIDQPWTDLTQATGSPVDRNRLAATLINSLVEHIKIFESSGLAPFVEQWQPLDVYHNKHIKLLMGKTEIEGICKGIDANGAILLETNGMTKAFHGGEISVRPI